MLKNQMETELIWESQSFPLSLPLSLPLNPSLSVSLRLSFSLSSPSPSPSLFSFFNNGCLFCPAETKTIINIYIHQC